jgi:putative transposase
MVIRTAVRAPKMNAVSERFVGSVRRERLDHVLVLDEGYLGHLLCQYQPYFNDSRPHPGIGQRVPTKPILDLDRSRSIEVTDMLRGLHVDDRRAA